MSPWHPIPGDIHFLSKDILFLFPFFGDFHTGRNTNHCRCHHNNGEYRHWRGTIFCCSFSSDHFSGIIGTGIGTGIRRTTYAVLRVHTDCSHIIPALCTFATFLCLLFCGIRPGCVAALCSGCAESPVAPP